MAYSAVMTDDELTTEIGRLYREAFRDYGSVALWSYRQLDRPTAAAALVVARALRFEGDMTAERIETLCRADH